MKMYLITANPVAIFSHNLLSPKVYTIHVECIYYVVYIYTSSYDAILYTQYYNSTRVSWGGSTTATARNVVDDLLLLPR